MRIMCVLIQNVKSFVMVSQKHIILFQYVKWDVRKMVERHEVECQKVEQNKVECGHKVKKIKGQR